MMNRVGLGWVALVLVVGCGSGDDEPPSPDLHTETIDAALPDAPRSPDAGPPRSDTDGDGLSDAQEDTDGDGVVDPGETDPMVADTDGDGHSDLIEWAAGTDGTDPASTPPADFVGLVIPYAAPEVSTDVTFEAWVNTIDVVFELDSTGSMGGTITTLADELQTIVVPGLALTIANIAMGVTQFKDFPVGTFGGPSDFPYRLEQRMTTDIAAVQDALGGLVAAGGGDGLESGIEALYQTVTGEGLMWTGPPAGEIEKFEPLIDYDPLLGHGLYGGVGFRDGALPIVVHLTDIEFHDGPDYWTSGVPDAHTRDEAVDAAYSAGVRFIGASSSSTSLVALRDISCETRTVVPASAAPPIPGLPTCPSGLVPIYTDYTWGGGGLFSLIEAIELLIDHGPLDVFGRPMADLDPDGFLPSVFITGISPTIPAPAGTVVDGNVLRMVPPYSLVSFTVRAHNTVMPDGEHARAWQVRIQGRAETWIDLNEQIVTLIVPAHP